MTTTALTLLVVAAPLLGGTLALFSAGRLSAGWSAVGAGIGALSGFLLAAEVFRAGPVVVLDGIIRIDALGAWVLTVVCVVVLIALAASPAYLRAEIGGGHLSPADVPRYYALVAWFVASLLAVPLFNNLGLLWVAVEATTVASALLVGLTRSPAALEAAWKYLILASIGIGFALLGTLLAYASSVSVLGTSSDALNWSRLMAIAPELDPTLLRLAFIFVLVGYGTKAGLVPFHTWLPDAHSQAPSPVSALLSGVALNGALYALIRFHLVASGGLGPSFSSTLLIVFGLLSLAVALPFITSQGDLKRLLAYSSVEHMGLVALGIGFGARTALLGAALHLLGHGLTKSTLFLSAGQVVEQYRTRRLGRIRGTLSAAPDAGGALLVGLLAIGGLPPSVIFVAEFAILLGGVESGAAPIVLLAAVLLAGTFAALAFHAARLAFGQVPGRVTTVPVSLGVVLRLGVPLGAVVVLGLWIPSTLGDVLDQVVRVLGGGGV